MRCRLSLLVASTLLLTGCGDPQPAEPATKTLTIAVLLGTAYLAIVVGGLCAGRPWRGWRARAANAGRPEVRWFAAIVLGAVPVASTVAAVAMLGTVAFGYTEAHDDLFTFSETVALTAWIGGFLALVALLHVRAALGAVVGSWTPKVLLGVESAVAFLAAASTMEPAWWAAGAVLGVLAALLPIATTPQALPAPPTSGMLSACR